MRARNLLPILAVIVATACDTASEPGRQNILGSWTTDDLSDTVISMTLGEAISVTGAGSWVDPDAARPFAVTGALAGDEVALYFDFPDADDVSFQGSFTDENLIAGTLNGASLRNTEVTFERVE